MEKSCVCSADGFVTMPTEGQRRRNRKLAKRSGASDFIPLPNVTRWGKTGQASGTNGLP